MDDKPAYIGRAEAAKELRVSERALHSMIRRGILIPHHVAAKKREVFLLADVQMLRVALGEDKNPDLRQVKGLALQALAAARRAENRLADAFEQLGLDIPIIPRDEHYVRSLHTLAQRTYDADMVTNPEWVKFWSDAFFGMDEAYLELVTMVTGDDEPWKHFLDFASRITLEMHVHEQEVALHSRRLFQAARNHLRYVAYMHCRRLHSARTANVIFDGRVSAVDELEAILG